MGDIARTNRNRNILRRTPAQLEAMAAKVRPTGRSKRGIAAPSRLHGVRPDRVWVRPGCEQVRPDLGNLDLVDALEWQHVRCGDLMTDADRSVLEELERRAWSWTEVNAQRLWVLPAWADEIVPTRRGNGMGRFLAVLLAAYRAGATGVLLGYHECEALCRVSRDTWCRWTRELEAAGLVRVVQTWRADPTTSGRARCHAKLLYRLGPAWEEAAGPGLCDRAADEGEVSRTWAARMAMGARARARAARDERRDRSWAAAGHSPEYRKPTPAKATKGPRGSAPSRKPARVFREYDNRGSLPPHPSGGGDTSAPREGAEISAAGAPAPTPEASPPAAGPTPPPPPSHPAATPEPSPPPPAAHARARRGSRPHVAPEVTPAPTRGEARAPREERLRLVEQLAGELRSRGWVVGFGLGVPPGTAPPEPEGAPTPACSSCAGSGVDAEFRPCRACGGSGRG